MTCNPLYRQEVRGISAFRDQAILPRVGSRGYVFGIRADSLFTEVRFTLSHAETFLLPPSIMSYKTYQRMKLRYDTRNLIRENFRAHHKRTVAAAGGEGIAIDVPFKIKSKAFRRIFGGDNIGLRVSGNITIDGSIRRQKFDELQQATQRDANTSFQIDMTQRFSITGKVGEKVEVKVDQDSERLFDFENSIMLTYTGNENEIIQKIEAGNVNLNLSGPRHATFSKRNQGLFGLKTEMKIGNLRMTGIASLERGQKNRLNPGQDTNQKRFSEHDYVKDRYFWLSQDSTDGRGIPVPDFREQHRHYDQNRGHTIVPGFSDGTSPLIQGVRVYKTIAGTQVGQNTFWGVAVPLKYDHLFEQENPDFTAEIGSSTDWVQNNWVLLNEFTDYTVDYYYGTIRLNQRPQPETAVACAFKLTSDTASFGSYSADVNADSLNLILLKTMSPRPEDKTWDLMFRHVYSLDAGNLDRSNFKLDIVRTAANSTSDEYGPPESNLTYLQFFDFDRTDGSGGGPDGQIDNIQGSLIDYALGEIHFLDLTPFNPSGYYAGNNPDPIVWTLQQYEEQEDFGSFISDEMYTLSESETNREPTRWQFRTEFQGSTSNFDLGPLVLEGSEEVTLNGAPLQRGIDYTIDYLSGRMVILKPEAKAEGAKLEITYESGQIFQLDKKTLFGVRAEYDLWGDEGNPSYIGGMMLHLNEKTLDRRVRVGNEPIRNTLYDMNTVLNFKPKFLTPMVNKIPLVSTDAPSTLSIEGEVAKVFPNPNSLSNNATGDLNGLAFLDDFEGSRRAVPLGMMRRNWSISSIPEDEDIDHRRGRIRWWNPQPDVQVDVQDVFPERETNTQVADRLQSIILEFTPDNTGVPERSWGGVMRYLGEGFADQTRAQFLEFWIQLPGAPEGRLVIDLGTISEDALPDGAMSTEDTPRPGIDLSNLNPLREYGDGILRPDEDTGIDGIQAGDTSDFAAWNGLDMPLVPSNDDYHYAIGSSDYDQINGTEGNLAGRDEGAGYPDTEDLNNNDILDLENNYFSYDIELSYDSPFIAGGFDNIHRWRLFRIPLSNSEEGIRREVGQPNFTNIRWTRIYMTGMSRQTKLQMVQMDIVSNEWLPEDSTERIAITVINNHENPGYESPPGVQGEIDPITNLRQREQSLILRLSDLNTSYPDYFIAKNLFQEINLIEYRQLKMFIHGGGIPGTSFNDGIYELSLRLGKSYSNIHADYYEIVQTIKPGWHPENEIKIALDSLSILHSYRLDSVQANNARAENDSTIETLSELMRFAYANRLDQPGDSLIVNGRPSLQNIGFIALGVRLRNGGIDVNKLPFADGEEIWVDELRLTDIHKDAGVAAEVRGSLNLADFAAITGSFSRLDADFHNVDQRTSARNLNSLEDREEFLGNVSLQLHKFYLERWGVQLPVSMQYSERRGTPKFIPNTDARVNPNNVADSIRSFGRTVTYSARYSKARQSPNPLVSWTLERLNLDWDRSETKDRSFRSGKSDREQMGASSNYEFPTAKGRGIAPLWFLQRAPLFSLIGNPRFYFKPRQLRVGLTADESNDVTRTPQGQFTRRRAFTMGQSFSTGFEPFDPLTLDLSRNHTTIHRSDSLNQKGWVEFLSGDLGRLTNVRQTFNSNYSPRLASWLQPRLSYSSNYTWSHVNLEEENNQNISNNRTVGADLSLDFRSIFGGGGGRRSRGREADRGRPPPSEPGEGDSVAVKPDEPGPSLRERLMSVLYPVRKAVSVLDPVSLGYDNTLTHNESGIVGQADPAYQFGLTRESGTSTVEGGGFITIPSLGSSQSYNARSGIRISRDINTTFDWDYRITEDEQTTVRQSTDQTMMWLAAEKDPARFPFVNLTMNWTGLEKFSFLDKATESISLSSGIASRMRESHTGPRDTLELQSREYTRQWNPLLGVNIGWKGNIDSQFRYNQSSTFREERIGSGLSKSSNSSASATLSYTIRTGFRLPLLWMNSIRLQNQTTLSMNFDYTTNKTEINSSNSDQYSVQVQQTSWSLQPRMTYSFSNTVQGQAHVMLQQTKDELTDRKTRLFEFGIQVNIAIRG